MTPSDWFHVISVIAAGIGIGVGVLMPARAQMSASAAAQRAMARQPDEAGTISRNLFIGLAMIESLALYVLITVLIVLFANPLDSRLADAEAAGPGAVWFLTGSSAAAIIAIAVAAMLAAIGQGRVTASALESISEQPEMRGRISTTLFISLAFLESLALYALIVALILLFANPLLDSVIP